MSDAYQKLHQPEKAKQILDKLICQYPLLPELYEKRAGLAKSTGQRTTVCIRHHYS